jgi:transposase-like protein
MKRSTRYSPEVIGRAVRMVFEQGAEHASHWAAIESIAAKIGCTAETLRRWVPNENEIRASAKARAGPVDLNRCDRFRRYELNSPAPDVGFVLGGARIVGASPLLISRLSAVTSSFASRAAVLQWTEGNYIRARPRAAIAFLTWHCRLSRHLVPLDLHGVEALSPYMIKVRLRQSDVAQSASSPYKPNFQVEAQYEK